MFKARTFLLETSRTPIYQRIIDSFRAAFVNLGHPVMLIEPGSFERDQDYLAYVNHQAADYHLITNPLGRISKYIEPLNAFAFESIDLPLIFIHHDSCFSHLTDLRKIEQLIQAYCRTQARSIHFCLEYSNFLDLRSLGIEQVYSSRIQPPKAVGRQPLNQPSAYDHEVSFVGHVLPGLGSDLEEIPCSHRLRADFWQRLVKFDYCIEPSAIAFAEQIKPQMPLQQPTAVAQLAAKSFYLALMHVHSQHFRGEVLRRVDAKLDIIGGDPSYLHGLAANQQIQQPNITYYPATTNYAETRDLYARSKINLNITSLQFDQAVINRVIDVAAAGGFVLTDWKADLMKLTSVAEQISYRSLEELNSKINYYLHPSHESERLEIITVLRQDIQQHCSYAAVVDLILSKLDPMSHPAAPVKIDLGCGPWKAEGFIGVDIAPGPGIDVVADLSQRFPFAESSIDLVRAYDVVEHLADRIHTMNEIWRICKPDGLVDIRVPSTDGRGAFQDPTHISFWNINSFKYYCAEFPAYLKLCHIYGFKGEFKLESLSEEASEDGVIHVKALLRAVKQPDIANLIATFKLRTENLLVCPDWQQPEDLLLSDLLELFKTALTHPNRSQMTLLIDAGSLAPEEADAMLTGLLMHLMAEDGIEIDEAGPEITLLSDLSPQQWQMLSEQITAQILFEQSTAAAVTVPGIQLAEFSQTS